MRKKRAKEPVYDEKMRYNGRGVSLGEYRKLIIGGYEQKLRLPLPKSDAELEVLSEFIFGVPLHLVHLGASGGVNYEVKEDHRSYYDHPFNVASHSGSSYEVDAFFWKTVMGALYCGGIAGSSYGQSHFSSHRSRRRIEHWVKYGRAQQTSGSSTLRGAFERLAARCRARREQPEPV